MLLNCLLLLLLLFSGQQAENGKKPGGKTRKYLGFSGYFRVLPALEIIVGHCQAFLTVVQSA